MDDVQDTTDTFQETATAALPPRTPLAAAVAAEPSPSTQIVTPEQALEHVEAHRMRALMVGMTGGSIVTAALVHLMSGDPFATRVHAIALLVSALLTGGYALVFRDPRSYRPMVALAIVMFTVVVMLTGYYFWGVFSAYAAVVPLTIYLAASATGNVKQALVGAGICVLAQTVFGVATVFGWIEPRGLVEPVRGSQTSQLIAIGLIQLLAIGAALGGRDIRRATQKVLDEHNQAVRELAQRDAQLAEARAEAVAAKKVAAGGMGRYSDESFDGFKLAEVIGRGGMGEIYAASRAGDAGRYAVKVLAPHLMRQSGAFERFQREGAMLMKLDSVHVVKVHAMSRADSPVPYLVMERLEGIDLATMLKERPVLGLAETVDLARQVAAGLDAAHRGGVIHRDLKPGNLFAVGDAKARIWKVLDFGASKWIAGEGTLTKDSILGTPAYMSPEQALGHKLDERSDVYSLGVILYRAVTGTLAVRPKEVPQMLHEVAYRTPARPGSVTDVPPHIELVLAIALAKSRMNRFATAGDLAAAYESAAQNRLDGKLATRAAQILRVSPWGTWLREIG